VPVVMRDHSHTFDSSVSAAFSQEAKFDKLGDVRVALKQYANTDPDTPGSGQLTAPWSASLGVARRF